jgi:23S rRNA (adenine2503-C2)-methyltransferase
VSTQKTHDTRPAIIGYNRGALRDYTISKGFPAYHGNQIWQWIYDKNVPGFDHMTDIPMKLREKLQQDFALDYFTPVHHFRSRRGDTDKYFYPLDGSTGIEAVALKDDEQRISFCISSQVGCPVGCIYCTTGSAGFIRDLSAGEIVTEVLSLMQSHGRPDSILFMGMGEPLLNLAEVNKAISLFHEMGISARRITVSTCGLIKGIYDLAASGLKPRLAVSLGSAIDHRRKKLIPPALNSSIRELAEALIHYREKTRRRVTLEYTLISGINDSTEDARALASFAKDTCGHVNLIRYNPPPKHLRERKEFSGLVSPKTEELRRFRNLLSDQGVSTTERYRRGTDIDAACGQLLFYKN